MISSNKLKNKKQVTMVKQAPGKVATMSKGKIGKAGRPAGIPNKKSMISR